MFEFCFIYSNFIYLFIVYFLTNGKFLKDEESDESEEERKPARKRQKADSGSEFEEFDEESNSESSVSIIAQIDKQTQSEQTRIIQTSAFTGRWQ